MFKNNKSFSSFSVNDLQQAKDFYGTTLGIAIKDSEMPGIMELQLEGNKVIIYTKADHTPATFTVLNFSVVDVEKAVDELTAKGVKFEQYDMDQLKTDSKGIMRSEGHVVAWFTDPAGNILSVMGEQ